MSRRFSQLVNGWANLKITLRNKQYRGDKQVADGKERSDRETVDDPNGCRILIFKDLVPPGDRGVENSHGRMLA